MSIPAAGDYLFVQYGFGGEAKAPRLQLLADRADSFENLRLRDQILTLEFDMSERFCAGWHDLAAGESWPCPDAAAVPDKYDQCHRCRHKTGFNPAFYHAASVSGQQQARNALPHTLYLAHFGRGVLKAGITWSGRGISRLLEQGARSCLLLAEYPNADVARHYEAAAVELPGIVETVQQRSKLKLLFAPYDADAGAAELLEARGQLADTTGLRPDEHTPLCLDQYYLGDNSLQPERLIDLTKRQAISGSMLGMVGGTLIARQATRHYALPLAKLRGYRLRLGFEETPNGDQPQQASLF